MPKTKNKIIVDTNILISFLLSKQDAKFDALFENNTLTLVFSKELLEEFVAVTTRTKFKKYFDMEDVENLLLKIKSRAIFVKVISNVNACCDAKDNFLLSLVI